MRNRLIPIYILKLEELIMPSPTINYNDEIVWGNDVCSLLLGSRRVFQTNSYSLDKLFSV